MGREVFGCVLWFGFGFLFVGVGCVCVGVFCCWFVVRCVFFVFFFFFFFFRLFVTCQYTVGALTPIRSAAPRMVTASSPASSSRPSAAWMMASSLTGGRLAEIGRDQIGGGRAWLTPSGYHCDRSYNAGSLPTHGSAQRW